jgi:two-component system OmpR family response regulator
VGGVGLAGEGAMKQSPYESTNWASVEMLSILCVDHDADIRMIVRIALELDGDVHTHLVSNAVEALRVLVSTDYQPHCILLDAAMPDADGRLLLGEIREMPHHRETPVIFLTADDGEEHRWDYRELGALGMIAKPFDPLALASQVRSLLKHKPV